MSKKTNKKKNKKLQRLGIVGIVVVVIIGVIIFQSRQSQQRYIESLESVVIEQGEIILVSLANGKITSSSEDVVSFSGSIIETYVELGETVEKDQELAEYKNALGQDKKLVSPRAGIVSSVPGVQSLDYVISDPNALQLVVNIAESDVYKIKEQQEATVFIEAINQEFMGIVEMINPVGNSTMDYTTYPVTISFDKQDKEVYLGMSASASVEIDRKDNILVVPFEAIISEGTDRYVIDSIWKENPTASKEDYYVAVTTGFADVFVVEVTGENLEGLEVLILPQDSTLPFLMPR
jgi:multidrug efflux pump subunit AcrA (membrane-fusion protein)